MLLIWTVYRVWGMRSCGESEEDEERGLKWPPKELSSPLLQYQIHSLWEVPLPSPLLWPPDAPPRLTGVSLTAQWAWGLSESR